MKNSSLINLIKILGRGYSEIVIDITINNLNINSIELSGDSIILHTFIDKFDIGIDYESLSEKEKKIICKELKEIKDSKK